MSGKSSYRNAVKRAELKKKKTALAAAYVENNFVEKVQKKPAKIFEEKILKRLMARDARSGSLILDKVIDSAIKQALNPKSPQATAAREWLSLRAIGRPKPSEEEVDTLKKGLITVYMNNPELSDVPVRENALPEPKPVFGGAIDAEVVE